MSVDDQSAEKKSYSSKWLEVRRTGLYASIYSSSPLRQERISAAETKKSEFRDFKYMGVNAMEDREFILGYFFKKPRMF